MLAMGLLSGLVMYLTAGATVGFMLGAYSGPAFESGREYMQLISLFYIFCCPSHCIHIWAFWAELVSVILPDTHGRRCLIPSVHFILRPGPLD